MSTFFQESELDMLPRIRTGLLKAIPTKVGVLASANCRSENIVILAIIILERKFGNVQREILGADLVIGPYHPALQDRPEAFNRIRVDCADDVLPLAVIDQAIVDKIMWKKPIRQPRSGRERRRGRLGKEIVREPGSTNKNLDARRRGHDAP